MKKSILLMLALSLVLWGCDSSSTDNAGLTNGTGSNGGNTNGTSATVATVEVSPLSATVSVGATQQLTAAAKDALGNAVSGVAFTWVSSDTNCATVDSSGLANGVAAGVANITATAGGISGSATLTVTSSSGGGGGAVTFGTNTKVNDATGTFYGGSLALHNIATSANTVYAAWGDHSTGMLSGHVYFDFSTDGGATWGTDKKLDTTSDGKYNQRIALDGSGNIYVTYNESATKKTYLSKSTDGGQNFTESVAVTDAGGNHNLLAISDSGVIDIVYLKSTGSKASIVSSSDGGATWSTASILTGLAGINNAMVDMAVVGDDVYIVTLHYESPNYIIKLHKRTSDGTMTVADVVSSPDVSGPSLAASASGIAVAWQNAASADSIWYAACELSLASKTSPLKIGENDNTIGSWSGPALAIEGSTIHAVWVSSYPKGLYYSASTDWSAFSSPVAVNTDTTAAINIYPSIWASGGSVDALWSTNNSVMTARGQ